jgi:hypothetical protein
MLIFSSPSWVLASPANNLKTNHSDGSVYCIYANDVSLTTRQIQTYQREGTLHDEIVRRSAATIRTVADRKPYEGTFQTSDLTTLRLAANTHGNASYHVSLQVDAINKSNGEVAIAVYVHETTPTITNLDTPGSILYRLFSAPPVDISGFDTSRAYASGQVSPDSPSGISLFRSLLTEVALPGNN